MARKLPEALKLIKECWKQKPSERPQFTTIAERVAAMVPTTTTGGDDDDDGLVNSAAVRQKSGFFADFEGVKHQVEAVARLRRELAAAAVEIDALPAHASDDLALLREVRVAGRDNGSAVQRIQAMIALRQKLGSDDVYRRIVEEDIPAHELPGAAEARAASWRSNEWLSMSSEFEVVVLEQLGAVKPETILAQFPVAK